MVTVTGGTHDKVMRIAVPFTCRSVSTVDNFEFITPLGAVKYQG
jgi:hypothetical protein